MFDDAMRLMEEKKAAKKRAAEEETDNLPSSKKFASE
jgi:hypothetical protein